jgi:5-formyltetrahydrofolate cyclo-ligase
MSVTKTSLRQRVKQGRLEMSEATRTTYSKAIIKQLKKVIDWPAIKTLHYFEPLHRLMEPDISPFITYLEDTYPKMGLFTSRLIGEEWQLVAVHGHSQPNQFDAIIVPMLGFDSKTLHRIGYGGGYYDKCLATQPQAQKIGVCFESGKLDQIPTEPHDIPLDLIITEDHIYSALI